MTISKNAFTERLIDMRIKKQITTSQFRFYHQKVMNNSGTFVFDPELAQKTLDEIMVKYPPKIIEEITPKKTEPIENFISGFKYHMKAYIYIFEDEEAFEKMTEKQKKNYKRNTRVCKHQVHEEEKVNGVFISGFEFDIRTSTDLIADYDKKYICRFSNKSINKFKHDLESYSTTTAEYNDNRDKEIILELIQQLEYNSIHFIFTKVELLEDTETDTKPTPITDLKVNSSTILDINNEFHDPHYSYDKCEYLSKHFKKGSCLASLFIQLFKNDIDDNYPSKLSITYSNIAKICKLSVPKNEWSLSISDIMPLVKYLGINLSVYDISMNRVFKYEAESISHKLRWKYLHVLIYNGHVYHLNTNLHKLGQLSESLSNVNNLCVDDSFNCLDDDKINNKFKKLELCEDDTDEEREQKIKHNQEVDERIKFNDLKFEIFIDEDYDTTFEKIRYTLSNLPSFKLKIISDSINTICFDLVEKFNIIPQIKRSNRFISKLRFQRKNKILVVEPLIENENNINRHTDLSTELNYELFNDIKIDVQKWLISKQHLSYYNTDSLEYCSKYPIKPFSRKFVEEEPENYTGLDMNLCYTSMLSKISMFPVYSYFDIWLPYDGHKIEEYTQYIIEINEKHYEDKAIQALLNDNVSRTFGFVITELVKYNYKFNILEYWRPFRLVPSNTDYHMAKAFNDAKKGLSKNNIKDIFNITLGIMEKRTKTKSISKIFLNRKEAENYKLLNGGDISVITNLDDDLDYKMGETQEIPKEIYLYEKTATRKLYNGFLQIKDAIYTFNKLSLFTYIKKIQQVNIEIIGIKTDNIIVNTTPDILFNHFKQVIDTSTIPKLNTWKIEKPKVFPKQMIDFKIIKYTEAKRLHSNFIKIDDEYNIQDSQLKNNLLITAEFAGCGKSYITQHAFKDKKKFITAPTNCLTQEINNKQKIINNNDDDTAFTLHKFLGIDSRKKKGLCETLDYDVIVLDEVYMYPPSLLASIYEFKRDFKDKYIIATGDSKQLPPITKTHNINPSILKNMDKYLIQIEKILFPNRINLNVIKRVDNDIDRQRLPILKNYLFNNDIDHSNIHEFLERNGIKCIDYKDMPLDAIHLAYTNDKCEQIINKIAKHKNIDVNTPVVGQNYICKTAFNKFIVNNIYKLDDVKNCDCAIFKSIKTSKTKIVCGQDDIKKYHKNKKVWSFVEQKIIKKLIFGNLETYADKFQNFKLDFCRTYHSTQGLTIRDILVLHESDMIDALGACYLWVGLTRANNLDNIYVVKSSKYSIEKRKQANIYHYFNEKIEGYKSQDNKVKREYKEEDYITYDWIISKLYPEYDGKRLTQKQILYHVRNYRCDKCSKNLEIYIDDNNRIISNLTINRLDNSKAHTIDNCNILCHNCNCSTNKCGYI